MAVELATGYVSLTVSAKGIGKDIENELGAPVAAAAKNAEQTATRSLQSAGQSFTKFGIGALAVAGVVGAGLLKTGESASNLGESVNAVQVTFGKAAGGILKLGEDAATSVGLSNAAFNALAVQFSAFATTIAGKGGDVVQTMSDMTGRAADFASVMNIDVADAATLFQSGLAGETEPLRKYGIDLSAAAVQNYALAHGIGTVGKQLTESEKVQARYASLMEQTSKTQGDFANTSDSAANATRIAKAEMENASASLGASLTPAMAFAATTVASLAGGFSKLNDATSGWLGKGAAIGVVALGAAGAISTVVGQVIKFRSSLTTVHGALVSEEGGLTRLGKAGKVAGIALAAVAITMYAVSKNAQSNAEDLAAVAKAAEDLTRVTDAQLLLTFNSALLMGHLAGKTAAETYGVLAHAQFEGTLRLRDYIQAQVDAGTAGQREKDQLAGLNTAINEENRARRQSTDTTAEYSDTAGGAADSTVDLTGKTEALSAADIILKGATDGIAAAAAEAKRKGDEYAKSLIDQRQRVEDLYATERSAVDAKYAFAESSRQAQLDLANLNTVLADHKSKQEDIDTAVRTASGSILKASEDYATLNGAALGSESGVRRQIDALTAQAATLAPGSPLRTFLEGYIGDLNRVQTDIQTRLTLNISMGSVTTAAGDIIGLRHVAGRTQYGATGGWRTGPTIVGEEGPELVDFKQPGYIHTAAATRGLMANTDFNMTNGTQRAGLNIEHLDVHNDTDADGFFRYANFLLAA